MIIYNKKLFISDDDDNIIIIFYDRLFFRKLKVNIKMQVKSLLKAQAYFLMLCKSHESEHNKGSEEWGNGMWVKHGWSWF